MTTSNDRNAPHERTALLPRSDSDASMRLKEKKKVTPLPKLQLAMVLCLQLSEPITALCIYPFINELVSGLDIIQGDTRKVGYYAGLIESLFFFTQGLTVFAWSRASDTFGRKPILLVGLFGLCISMISFGLSKTFWQLVTSRCLAGFLNGNIGVMKSMMGEITDSTNRAKAISFLPVIWCVGVTIGPLIGGGFYNPQRHWPTIFSSSFWAEYPYALPCFVAASYSAFAFLATAFFLEESLKRDKYPCDLVGGVIHTPDQATNGNDRVPLRAIFVRPVLLSVANYICVAILDIAYQALFPLFYFTEQRDGGLGLSPQSIGSVMAIYGIANGLFQGLFFSKILDKFGLKRLFLISMSFFVPLFAIFPVLSAVSIKYGKGLELYIILGIQIAMAVLVDLSFSCVFIYITSSAPSPRALGATNGLSQTAASFARTFGPAVSTSLFALSVKQNILGGSLVYVIMIVLSAGSLLVASLLPSKAWDAEDDENHDNEQYTPI